MNPTTTLTTRRPTPARNTRTQLAAAVVAAGVLGGTGLADVAQAGIFIDLRPDSVDTSGRLKEFAEDQTRVRFAPDGTVIGARPGDTIRYRVVARLFDEGGNDPGSPEVYGESFGLSRAALAYDSRAVPALEILQAGEARNFGGPGFGGPSGPAPFGEPDAFTGSGYFSAGENSPEKQLIDSVNGGDGSTSTVVGSIDRVGYRGTFNSAPSASEPPEGRTAVRETFFSGNGDVSQIGEVPVTVLGPRGESFGFDGNQGQLHVFESEGGFVAGDTFLLGSVDVTLATDDPGAFDPFGSATQVSLTLPTTGEGLVDPAGLGFTVGGKQFGLGGGEIGPGDIDLGGGIIGGDGFQPELGPPDRVGGVSDGPVTSAGTRTGDLLFAVFEEVTINTPRVSLDDNDEEEDQTDGDSGTNGGGTNNDGKGESNNDTNDEDDGDGESDAIPGTRRSPRNDLGRIANRLVKVEGEAMNQGAIVVNFGSDEQVTDNFSGILLLGVDVEGDFDAEQFVSRGVSVYEGSPDVGLSRLAEEAGIDFEYTLAMELLSEDDFAFEWNLDLPDGEEGRLMNLGVQLGVAIPEPTSVALLGLGGLLLRRRRWGR